MMILYGPADPEHRARERRKARELRKSSWWKQRIGQGICYHCKSKFAKELLTMDHLIPIARGGTSTKKNCVVACKECNSKKGGKLGVELVLEEMAAIGTLPSVSGGDFDQEEE